MYDPKTNTLDLNKRKITDIKDNWRIILPKALPAKHETMIEVRNEAFR